MDVPSALGLTVWWGQGEIDTVLIVVGEGTGTWSQDRTFDVAGNQEMPTQGSDMELRPKVGHISPETGPERTLQATRMTRAKGLGRKEPSLTGPQIQRGNRCGTR